MNRAILAAAAGVVVTVIASPTGAPAQAPGRAGVAEKRPIPSPVRLPAQFRRAVERGTRTSTGEPGAAYWQQDARYRITAEVDPHSKHLEGRATLTYFNRSPEALSDLVLKLYQNFHAAGVERNDPAEVTGGITLHRLAIDGRPVAAGDVAPPRYVVAGTLLALRLEEALAPGDSLVLELEWGFDVPQVGASERMGWNGDNLMLLAYWYPQFAVYDDVIGWHEDPFLGRGEFYSGFADYDVRVTAPEGWVVLGTGRLVNGHEVLPAEILARVRRSEASDEIVHVLTAEDFGPGRATLHGGDGRLTWHLRAAKVRDMVFSMTRESLWDAVRAPVGDRDGDGATDYTRVDALYRASTGWRDAAGYARHAIAFLSRYLDLPYPWSHVTAVEGNGIIAGGMEYPMLTLMGSYEGVTSRLAYDLVAHELAHMWMPMIVSSDETRWAWMDEAPAEFASLQAAKDFMPDAPDDATLVEGFTRILRAGLDATVMRRTDWADPDTWWVGAYSKPTAALHALREVVGRPVFDTALRAYVRNWAWKHPKPTDLFHTFETVSGSDLDWFWRGWFFEEWKLDHAVASVEANGRETVITVADRGDLPMPVRVTVTRADGTSDTYTIDVERWLSGGRVAALTIPAGSPVVRVELDADGAFPDVNRDNDVWEERDGR